MIHLLLAVLALAVAASSPVYAQTMTPELTIAQIHKALADGTLTCRALVEGYLARIAAFDQKGPKLNAVITVNPRALETADAMDKARKADPAKLGSLHCIPILVKDNYDTADMPTTGSSAGMKNSQPQRDAFTIAKLRAAGAIIIAKTTLSEFAMGGLSAGSLHGQTLNPYDQTRTPGGSSGGTGAGLAAGYAVFGTGSDTGQSIRSPSSANALVGIRSTRGLISRAGIIPLSFTQDEAGPLAHNVEDLARALDVFVGFDPADPITAGGVAHIPKTYTSFLNAAALKGKRIGILRQYFGTDAVHGEVNAVMAKNIDALKQAGAEVVDIQIPNLDELTADMATGEYETKAAFDLYIKNVGPKAAVKSYDEWAAGNLHPTIAAQAKAAQKGSMADPKYAAIFIRRDNLRKAVLFAMAQNNIDAIAYPHQKRLVVKVGEEQVDRNGVLSNATGFPAITVPGGFSPATPEAPIGVPVGLEFLSRDWTEGDLIGIAYAFEQATKYRKPPVLK